MGQIQAWDIIINPGPFNRRASLFLCGDESCRAHVIVITVLCCPWLPYCADVWWGHNDSSVWRQLTGSVIDFCSSQCHSSALTLRMPQGALLLHNLVNYVLTRPVQQVDRKCQIMLHSKKEAMTRSQQQHPWSARAQTVAASSRRVLKAII